MAKVLTTGSTVMCKHGGKVATGSTAKLTVNGLPVLLAAGVSGRTVTTCPITDDPNTSTTKCRTVAAIIKGPAVKLKVGGQPVILDTLTGMTNGTPPPPPLGPPLDTAVANQTKLGAS
jgi:hypothetical protein